MRHIKYEELSGEAQNRVRSLEARIVKKTKYLGYLETTAAGTKAELAKLREEWEDIVSVVSEEL